jgi:hypothetical protein
MDARRLILTPFIAGALAAAVIFGIGAQATSAEVPAPQVSPYLRAAIKAEAEARGYNYAGDFKFDQMYAAPGMWVSSVQSVGANEAVVTFGKYASDEIVTVKFVPKGNYGWVNPESGVGSPQVVPVMAGTKGDKADTWVIEGMDFPPNQEVALFDGSALGGEMRTPTDHKLAVVKTDATGAFKVTVEFGDYPAQPGQVHRLIQASGGAILQVAFHHDGETPAPTPTNPTPAEPTNPPADPTKPSPAPSEPTKPSPAPGQPTTPEVPADNSGDDDGDDDDNALAYAAVAVIGVLGLAGGFGIVTMARRR